MSNKVYGFCDAGCKYRVPTYEEFENSASIIKVAPDNLGVYHLEVGKKYKIRSLMMSGWGALSISMNWQSPAETDYYGTISVTLPEEKDFVNELTFCVLGTTQNIYTLCDGTYKEWETGTSEFISELEVTVKKAAAVYLVNEDATINIEVTGKDGEDGKDGTDGVSVTHSWDGTILTVTSASGTSSADLQGTKGADGKDGKDGEDGISPTISVSRITEGTEVFVSNADGTSTTVTIPDGANGKDGTDGKDGADGTSVTIADIAESTTDGGSNIVTFSDGKILTVKNGKTGASGKDGKDGTNGADGYTPVKGTDYFTDAEIDDIAARAAQIEPPKIVSSVSEMTDTTKHYVNKDTGTIWAYMKHTKIVAGSTVANFTNLFDADKALINYRWSASAGGPTANGGYIMSDFIAANLSSGEHIIRIKNAQLHNSVNCNTSIVYLSGADNSTAFAMADKATPTATEEADGVFAYKLGEKSGSMIDGYTNTRYIRCVAAQWNGTTLVNPQTLANAKNIIITIDEPITYTVKPETTETYYEWTDTGISYAPAFKTDLIGVLGEGNVIYLSDNALPSGTYTLKYGEETYETIGTITV